MFLFNRNNELIYLLSGEYKGLDKINGFCLSMNPIDYIFSNIIYKILDENTAIIFIDDKYYILYISVLLIKLTKIDNIDINSIIGFSSDFIFTTTGIYYNNDKIISFNNYKGHNTRSILSDTTCYILVKTNDIDLHDINYEIIYTKNNSFDILKINNVKKIYKDYIKLENGKYIQVLFNIKYFEPKSNSMDYDKRKLFYLKNLSENGNLIYTKYYYVLKNINTNILYTMDIILNSIKEIGDYRVPIEVNNTKSARKKF